MLDRACRVPMVTLLFSLVLDRVRHGKSLADVNDIRFAGVVQNRPVWAGVRRARLAGTLAADNRFCRVCVERLTWITCWIILVWTIWRGFVSSIADLPETEVETVGWYGESSTFAAIGATISSLAGWVGGVAAITAAAGFFGLLLPKLVLCLW